MIQDAAFLQLSVVDALNVFSFILLFFFLLELFWTAPEFLSDCVGVRFSQPGDVYSYGIILNELLSREEPYSSFCTEPRGEFTIAKVISKGG